MNSRQNNFTLWSKTKELVDNNHMGLCTRTIRKDPQLWQFILDETSHFPNDRKLPFRIHAIVNESDYVCVHCGNFVKQINKKFCCHKCSVDYRNENQSNETLPEILKKVPHLPAFNPDDFPNGTAEPIDPEQFIHAWNRIKEIGWDFAKGETHQARRNHASNNKRIMHSHLAKIATWNTHVDNYLEQTVRCFQHPLENKTENLEWFTMLYGEERAKQKMERKSEQRKGENNPAYDHGGRLSPFSKKFVHGDIREQTIKKACQTREQTNGYNTRLSYWTERYGEEKGKQLYYDRQHTFSLEKNQQKYGEQEGYRIWKERQDKWQDTLQNLPEEQKVRISAKKGFWRHYKPLTDQMDPDSEFNQQDSILYVIEYQPRGYTESFIKVGVTCRYLTDRFLSICIKDRLLIHHSDRFTNFQLERDVKEYIVNNNLHIMLESERDRFDGWTECVSAEHKDEILGVVNEAIRKSTEKV